jgi:hypothetical protein
MEESKKISELSFENALKSLEELVESYPTMRIIWMIWYLFMQKGYVSKPLSGKAE